jgi:hypothetical protein
MNCLFCQQSTISKVISTADGYVPLNIDYTCAQCDALFEYDCEHDIMTGYRFYIDDMVVWFYPVLEFNSREQFAITKNIPPAISGIYEDLCVLDFIPNITPSNFYQKYQTLINFS